MGRSTEGLPSNLAVLIYPVPVAPDYLILKGPAAASCCRSWHSVQSSRKLRARQISWPVVKTLSVTRGPKSRLIGKVERVIGC